MHHFVPMNQNHLHICSPHLLVFQSMLGKPRIGARFHLSCALSVEGMLPTTDKYDELKRCLRTKHTDSHTLVARLLCDQSPKEFVCLVRFMIVFISQYMPDFEPETIYSVYQSIQKLMLIADASEIACQQAAGCLVDQVLAHTSSKLLHMQHHDHDYITNVQYACDLQVVSYIQVMKSAMCSNSFALLTTMCIFLKQKDAEKAIHVIRHILSCKTLVIQRIQYPDIALLKPSERQNVIWYCWKALLYSEENKKTEKYVRYLLSMFVITYDRKQKLNAINLLFHACKIASKQGMTDSCTQPMMTDVRKLYKNTATREQENNNGFKSALMFVPVIKSGFSKT